jgi:protein phosphatase
MTSTREILAAVEASRDLDDAARALVEAANAGGGEDNITVVLFEIAGSDTDELGETAQLPAASEDDDEDTLSPLDAVPAVDTAVIPAAVVEEHLQQIETDVQSQPEPRRRILPLVVLIVLLVALVALALWGLTR